MLLESIDVRPSVPVVINVVVRSAFESFPDCGAGLEGVTFTDDPEGVTTEDTLLRAVGNALGRIGSDRSRPWVGDAALTSLDRKLGAMEAVTDPVQHRPVKI